MMTGLDPIDGKGCVSIHSHDYAIRRTNCQLIRKARSTECLRYRLCVNKRAFRSTLRNGDLIQQISGRIQDAAQTLQRNRPAFFYSRSCCLGPPSRAEDGSGQRHCYVPFKKAAGSRADRPSGLRFTRRRQRLCRRSNAPIPKAL